MKKFIFVLTVLISAECMPIFAYTEPAAVIVNYDDFEDDLIITRANGEPEGSDALLYSGDKVEGEISELEIKLSPYAEIKTDGKIIEISYNPPLVTWGVAQTFYDDAMSFWSNVETVTTGASRGFEAELNLNPKPGFDVTLLKNSDVLFSWDEPENGKFFIKDENGEIIFEKEISGESNLHIKPSDIKAESEKYYTWGINDGTWEYKFSVLDDETEKNLLLKFDEIDGEFDSQNERALRKSAYLQLISGIYSDKIDLYWLSLQLLKDVSDNDEKLILLKNFERHLDEEMQ